MLGDIVTSVDNYDRTLYDHTGLLAPVGPAQLGRDVKRVLAFTRWHRIEQHYGNFYVSAETDDREHHATCRAAARKYVADALGPDWQICAYIGRENYRNCAGYPSWARRYSIVYVGKA